MRSALPAFWFLLLFNLAVSLLALVLALAHGQRPDRYFMEGAFTTWVSCAQLLAVAALADGIYLARRRVAALGAKVWLLMAGGLAFLAADDAFEIHENFDFWVHRTFHLRETALSDRIDDAVIILYGLTSLVVLWIYRREMVPFRTLRGGHGRRFRLRVRLDALRHRGRPDRRIALLPPRPCRGKGLTTLVRGRRRLVQAAGRGLLRRGLLRRLATGAKP